MVVINPSWHDAEDSSMPSLTSTKPHNHDSPFNPGEGHAFIDILDEDDDDDDAASITSSLSQCSSNYSTVSSDHLPPIHAYSRTYHGSGRLLFPNDAAEAHRLSIQHSLFQLCLDGDLIDTKLPLDDEQPLEILDVGAGSGLWACDMATRYPQVEILGIDLSSALLPEDVPPNVTFEMADAMEPWPDKEYDFIHMRNLIGGGIRDWAALLSSAFSHLKPGGHLEFTEICPQFFDVDPNPLLLPSKGGTTVGAACREYETRYRAMTAQLGVDFDPVPKVGGWLSDVGAENIRERVDWLPVRSWGNDPIMRRKGETLGKMIECGM